MYDLIRQLPTHHFMYLGDILGDIFDPSESCLFWLFKGLNCTTNKGDSIKMRDWKPIGSKDRYTAWETTRMILGWLLIIAWVAAVGWKILAGPRVNEREHDWYESVNFRE